MMRVLLVIILFLPISLSAQQVSLDPGSQQRLTLIPLKKPGKGNFGLYSPGTGKTYPVQWLDDESALVLLQEQWHPDFLLKETGKTKKSVILKRDTTGILVSSGDKKVFYYQSSTAMPPADSPAYYQRSGFIHPLYSPAGKILTDNFPVTHAHQHAIFHAWTDTRFRGSHIDFWNQFKKEGTVKHKGVLHMAEGPVFSEMVTTQEYISIVHGVVLSEKWAVRIYGPQHHFMFDLTLEQENITSDTLFLDKYIYGGMAFRGAAQWDPQNKNSFQNSWNVISSEGLKDSLANHTSAKWMTVTGTIDGVKSSVTVFGHPGNFRAPQKVRVHPTMPYWAFSPVVDGAFHIPPGGKYSARYRYLVTTELPGQEELKRIYEQWSKM